MINQTIYTDGSCYWKTREGGFAVYFKDQNKALSQGWTNTSTDRMEIMGVLTAIKNIPNIESNVLIILDNEYVVKTIREGWIYKWFYEGWKDRTNSDLWKQVLEEIKARPLVKIRLKHVKGHQKDLENEDVFYNNLVDRLADYKNFKNKKRNVDKNQ